MARFLALFLLLCMVAPAIDEEPPRVVIDEKRYADLLEDPYARRILGVIFHVGNGAGAYRFTEEEQADRRWFNEQGTKAFPVLLEVIKREPSPVDSPTAPEAWHALARSRRILDWTNHFPEGEFQPLVEEVRRQVARLKGFRSPQWGHLQYLKEGFEFLAIHGNESDIQLMEQFLEDEDVGNRDSARGGIMKLKARLEAEGIQQTPGAKADAVAVPEAEQMEASGNQVVQSPGSAAGREPGLPIWLRWAISILVLAGILWHWRRTAKRRKSDHGGVA